MDIFRRVAEHRGWDEAVEEDVEVKEAERRVWNVLMQQLHEPFAILSEAIEQGLEHAGIQLELLPRPKEKADAATNPDVEAQGEQARPGDAGFAKVIDDKVKRFTSTKSEILRVWARERGLAAEEETTAGAKPADKTAEDREREHSQLYVLLYMEQLVSHLPPTTSYDTICEDDHLTALSDVRCMRQGKQSRILWILPIRRWPTAP